MATLDPYDGVLLVSFGGPESPGQVLPFLRSVTAGRGIPDERSGPPPHVTSGDGRGGAYTRWHAELAADISRAVNDRVAPHRIRHDLVFC